MNHDNNDYTLWHCAITNNKGVIMEPKNRIAPYPFRMKPEMRQWIDGVAQEKRRSTQVQLEYILELVKEKVQSGEFELP